MARLCCARPPRRVRRAALQAKQVATGRPTHVTARAAWRACAFNGASPWVLRVLREGLLLQWRRRPPARKVPPIPLPQDVTAWAEGEVSRWAARGHARRAAAEEEASSAWEFTSFVVSVSEKPRLVFDYSPQNEHLHDRAFKYLNLPAFVSALNQDDHLISWDGRDAFHDIRLAPRERARLAFRVAGVLYFPLTLPFGLKLAPWALTRACARCSPTCARQACTSFRTWTALPRR